MIHVRINHFIVFSFKVEKTGKEKRPNLFSIDPCQHNPFLCSNVSSRSSFLKRPHLFTVLVSLCIKSLRFYSSLFTRVPHRLWRILKCHLLVFSHITIVLVLVEGLGNGDNTLARSLFVAWRGDLVDLALWAHGPSVRFLRYVSTYVGSTTSSSSNFLFEYIKLLQDLRILGFEFLTPSSGQVVEIIQ